MRRTLALAATSLALASPTLADIESLAATGSVAEVMDRLETAVTGAGATVFARVDHGAGATSAGLELSEAQLLIFGNPQLGTLPMQDDIRAGLYLPLKMLVYTENDETRIAWVEADDMFDDLDISDDAEYIAKIGQALQGMANKAAGTQ